MDRADVQSKVAEKWSNNLGAAARGTRWYHFPLIVQHINERVCGKPLPNVGGGLNELIKARFADELPVQRGVAVGAGTGAKEIKLVKAGIAETFVLYELSSARIEAGRKLVADSGLSHKISFCQGDAFAAGIPSGAFDIVHWNNSLHHMMDVNQAVAWSRRVLREGGIFAMDDFVGPTYKQWESSTLEVGTRILSVLPERYRVNFRDRSRFLPPEMRRLDVQRQIADDPSECADSANILPAIEEHFPEAEVINTGGVIYHGALADYLANFDLSAEEDLATLRLALLVDDLCADAGMTAYACAVARKTTVPNEVPEPRLAEGGPHSTETHSRRERVVQRARHMIRRFRRRRKN